MLIPPLRFCIPPLCPHVFFLPGPASINHVQKHAFWLCVKLNQNEKLFIALCQLTRKILPHFFSARTSAATLAMLRCDGAMEVRVSLCRSFSAPLGLSSAPLLVTLSTNEERSSTLFSARTSAAAMLRCIARCAPSLHRWGCLPHLHWCSVDLQRMFFHSVFAPPLQHSSIAR